MILRLKLWYGRLLNLFGANLELCDSCGRYTTWDEKRLWGRFMFCAACDRALVDDYLKDLGVGGGAHWAEGGAGGDHVLP